MAALFIQCTADQKIEQHSADLALIYEQELDLSKQLPTALLDITDKGLYVGTVATTDLSFHQKIFINVENDGNINAQVSSETGKMYFLKGTKLQTKVATYFFAGRLGEFKLTVENNKATITNATLLNKVAVVNVLKSTSTSTKMPSLGAFQNGDGSVSGTWDFMWQQISPDLFESISVSIIKDGGSSFSPMIPVSTYERACLGTDFTVFDLQAQSDANTEILGIQLNYNIVAQVADQASCPPAPMAPLQTSNNTWDWNEDFGNVMIDQNSLPTFD